jgi:hypothetical protein
MPTCIQPRVSTSASYLRNPYHCPEASAQLYSGFPCNVHARSPSWMFTGYSIAVTKHTRAERPWASTHFCCPTKACNINCRYMLVGSNATRHRKDNVIGPSVYDAVVLGVHAQHPACCAKDSLTYSQTTTQPNLDDIHEACLFQPFASILVLSIACTFRSDE